MSSSDINIFKNAIFKYKVWLGLFILLPVTALVLALLDYIGTADPQQKFSYLVDSYGFFVFQNVAMQGKAVFKIHNFKES